MTTVKSTTLTFRNEPERKEALRSTIQRDHRNIADMVSVLIQDQCEQNGIEIQNFQGMIANDPKG